MSGTIGSRENARWGWAVLLLNQPFNIPATMYLLFAHRKHHWRYALAMFAPYAAGLLVAWRYVDWTTLLRG